jgi:glutamate N-acetyltransferase/amino-acid N-acetyltransferase
MQHNGVAARYIDVLHAKKLSRHSSIHLQKVVPSNDDKCLDKRSEFPTNGTATDAHDEGGAKRVPGRPVLDKVIQRMTQSFAFEDALPLGFRFAAAKAGLKASGNPDFAVAVADAPASAAALFTANRVKAAPLAVGAKHLARSGGRVRVIAVNAGNANCATGEAGLAACKAVCEATAKTFGAAEHEVFPSSTGIIGVPLPAEKLVAALSEIQRTLAADAEHFAAFAQAILTTDTRPKVASAQIEVEGKPVRIAGVCKGAGMIHPQLVPHATMLVYLFTDAAIAPSDLNTMLREAVEVSFNRISIDGDTSTNDTVLLLASGASGAPVTLRNTAFASALTEICTSLARQIVADGEGVTHVIELQIEGAATDADALKVAKAIAHSPLVKTAWAGSDPNWGRLMAATGYSGAAVEPERIAIWFGDQQICIRGGRAPNFDEHRAHAYLKNREFTIHIDLGIGQGQCRFWTTDLTAEYVHINADYST